MKIIAAPSDSGGCGAYRISFPYSRLKGHKVDFVRNASDPRIQVADAAVMQRVSTQVSIAVMRSLRASGKPVILEFDDNLHALPSCNPCSAIYGNGKEATNIFEESLSLASIVTCSTEQLAEQYGKFRSGIVVCPNVILDEHIDDLQSTAPTGIGPTQIPGEIRIGYVGSTTHLGDVTLVSKALQKIANKYPEVRFVFMGQPPVLPRELSNRILFHPGVAPNHNESPEDFILRYYKVVRSLQIDIAIAPLESHVFNQAKSWIKILEMGAVGLPIVASNTGPYRSYKNNGGLILTANDDREWVSRLSELIESDQMRMDLADRNLEHIRQSHTMRTGIRRWEGVVETLESLLPGKEGSYGPGA